MGLISDMLERYAKSGAERFHMPGHKGKGEGFLSSVYPYDVTELSFSDNLADPEGVILQAEEDLARIVGAKRSRILTGGSTLGVLVSVYAAYSFFKSERKKLVVPKSSHKSVYNAMRILDLEPVFIPEKIVGGLTQIELKKLPELCDNGVIGVLLTSPDYFGRVTDLAFCSGAVKKCGGFLITDGAHGAHLPFTDERLYAGRFSDIWVDGAHKTLSTLTPGALLNIGDERLTEYVEDGLSIFSSSSPSYLISASVEDGYKKFAGVSSEKLSECKKAVSLFTKLLDSGLSVVKNDDYLKITVDLKNENLGAIVGKKLEEKKVYAELACGRFVLFMASVDFDEAAARNLADKLNAAFAEADEEVGTRRREDKEKTTCVFSADEEDYPVCERKISFVKARTSDFERVDLKDAVGRISAAEVGLFPPCFPLVVAGEVFDNGVIARLLRGNTFGVKDGKVKVVKDDSGCNVN